MADAYEVLAGSLNLRAEPGGPILTALPQSDAGDGGRTLASRCGERDLAGRADAPAGSLTSGFVSAQYRRDA